MKSFLSWLAGLFRIEETWVDKGQGKWVRKRRLHPLTRVLVIVAVLTLGISWGVNSFSPRESPELPREARTRPEIRETGMPPLESPDVPIPAEAGSTDVEPPDLTKPAPPPGPLPEGLALSGGEYWIRISKQNYSLYLYRGASVELAFRVAIGRNTGDKQRSGDNRTPEGIFSVQSIEDARTWSHDFRDGKGMIRSAYGPWFIRLRMKWKGIGIHGTHAPDSIGTMVSEGCIRMQNEDLEELKQFAAKNMKVVIEE
ncbi:MAG: L,D-transpeptidase [Synergistaceae bacterium]|jgi:lipoprotein-anchoring transpeptidase ErfK/SrfK|nr:L,D-transpeptidase [Synergistaceae bacterium]